MREDEGVDKQRWEKIETIIYLENEGMTHETTGS